MLIIHAGNFSLKARGAAFHSVCHKISYGLIRTGHQVINFSDRDTARLSNIFRSRKLGISGCNKALLELCKTVRPDLVIFGHANTIRPATLRNIRKMCPETRMIQWYVDNLEYPENVDIIRSKLPFVDATFISTAGKSLQQFRHGNNIVEYLPNPADKAIEKGKSFLHEHLAYDLFCATGNPEMIRPIAGSRLKTRDFLQLIKDGVDNLSTCFPGVDTPHMSGYQYQSAMEHSKCGLNFSRFNHIYLYSSDRIAHLMGNGLLTFIDSATGFRDIFADDEAVFFTTPDELIDKVKYYTSHDRDRMAVAQKGWLAYHSRFSSERICGYMLDATFGKVSAHDFVW